MRHPTKEQGIVFLTAIRGTFGPPLADSVGHAMISGFLCLVGPAVVFSIVATDGRRHFPVGFDQWFVVVVALLNVYLGVFLWRKSGTTYVFDGISIRAVSRSGKVWKEIKISEIVSFIGPRKISWSVSSIQTGTDRMTMEVVLYPKLTMEIERLSKKSPLPTQAGVIPAAGAPVVPPSGAAGQ